MPFTKSNRQEICKNICDQPEADEQRMTQGHFLLLYLAAANLETLK